MKNIPVDVLIIGAGAAGLMTAISVAKSANAAGQPVPKIVVLDHANKAGKKILMSGGGRCNFTNLHCGPENFLSANPHFCKSALARFTPADFIALVEQHGIAYHEKTLGQLFCDESSKDILNMLLAEAAAANIQLNTAVRKIQRGDDVFHVETNTAHYDCNAVVVASGGLSIPKMGATGFGYEIARQFGLKIEATRAGLVPFTLQGAALESIANMKGLAIDPITASVKKRAFREAMLCTHRGLSGPAMLQISSYWREGEKLQVDLFPDGDAQMWLQERIKTQPKAELKTVLAQRLPRRFAEYLTAEFGNPRLVHLSGKGLASWVERLENWAVLPSGTEGYRTAEVTLGGVSTAELSSRTLECRSVPGLYFVGEVVDVTGHLGGHNFQWAWASAHAAGQAIAEKVG